MAGRQMNRVRQRVERSVAANSWRLPRAEREDMLGKAAVDTARPKTPSGNSTSLSA